MCALVGALAYGFAFRTPIPSARYALRRGLVIAQDSGNRGNESHLAGSLAELEADLRRPAGRARIPHAGDPQPTTTRQHHDDPSRRQSSPFVFDRLGRHEAAATIAGFAVSPSPRGPSRDHHRDRPPARVLGDPTYESLARKGKTMTTAAIVTYAYDQIDQARAELNAVL